MDKSTKKAIGVIVGVIISLVAIALICTIPFSVPAGKVGIVLQWRAVNRVVQPGFGIKIPIAERVVFADLRTQLEQVGASAASKDLQKVTSTIAVNYRLDPQYVVSIYQSVGVDYKNILLTPAIQNIFKATTAQYTAEELITKREDVRSKAEEALVAQLAVYHFIVENFNIIDFDFSPEFNTAIEKKQVAQQEVETAKQQLARALVDAQTAITAAKGQADAQAALKNAGALTQEYLQYLALTKWNGQLPRVTGSGTPFIDVSSLGGLLEP